MSAKPDRAYAAQMAELMCAADESDADGAVAVLEAAVRLADSQQQIEDGVGARIDLLQKATNAGRPEKALVAFSWCLGQYDKDPEKLADFVWQLGWYYKWVMEHAPEFPQIQRQQLEGMLADMARRYEAWGYSLRPVHQYACTLALMLGDRELVEAHFGKWQALPQGEMADCPACEADMLVRVELWRGDLKRAQKAAAPLLERRMTCAEVPLITQCRMMMPLALAGDWEKAEQLQRASRTRFKTLGTHLVWAGEHMKFYTLRGETSKAQKVFEQFLPNATTARSLLGRLEFLKGAWLFFADAAERGTRELRLRVNADVPWKREDDRYAPETLAEWARGEIATLSLAFDKRNGNNEFSNAARENEDLLKRVSR